jgi:hypothetical protein
VLIMLRGSFDKGYVHGGMYDVCPQPGPSSFTVPLKSLMDYARYRLSCKVKGLSTRDQPEIVKNEWHKARTDLAMSGWYKLETTLRHSKVELGVKMGQSSLVLAIPRDNRRSFEDRLKSL